MSLPTPTLHTARLLLRPFTDADRDSLFALHTNPRVLHYWDAPPWGERTHVARRLHRGWRGVGLLGIRAAQAAAAAAAVTSLSRRSGPMQATRVQP
jgi:RimJ/RimL family protein N-acetyltransferase